MRIDRVISFQIRLDQRSSQVLPLSNNVSSKPVLDPCELEAYGAAEERPFYRPEPSSIQRHGCQPPSLRRSERHVGNLLAG